MQFFTYTAPSKGELSDLIKRNHGEDVSILKSHDIRPKSHPEGELWEAIVVVPKTPKQATKSPTNVPANPPAPPRISPQSQEPPDDSENILPDNAVQSRLNRIAQKEIERRRELRERERQNMGELIRSKAREISEIIDSQAQKPPYRFVGGDFRGQNPSKQAFGQVYGQGYVGAAEGESRQNRPNASQSPQSRAAENRFEPRAGRDVGNTSEAVLVRETLPKKASQEPSNGVRERDSRALELAQNREQGAFRREMGEDLKIGKEELKKIHHQISILQSMVLNSADVRTQRPPSFPPELSEIYRICKNSGMKREHLDDIMELAVQNMRPKILEDGETTKRCFREILRKTITCRVENIVARKRKIVMFVGPTGVGKTTTLAKLATRYSKIQRKRVGLISLDAYRIGAVEQLLFYSKKLQLSLIQANDTNEFGEALDSLRECDYILIDTIGCSQKDAQKLKILRRYAGNQDYQIDVNLVLCANTKFEDLSEIYAAFSPLNVDTLIFSKLDESSGFGNVYSLAYDTQKPISYFTTGQEVPEDIVVAQNGYLADCMIYGFNKPEAGD